MPMKKAYAKPVVRKAQALAQIAASSKKISKL